MKNTNTHLHFSPFSTENFLEKRRVFNEVSANYEITAEELKVEEGEEEVDLKVTAKILTGLIKNSKKKMAEKNEIKEKVIDKIKKFSKADDSGFEGLDADEISAVNEFLKTLVSTDSEKTSENKSGSVVSNEDTESRDALFRKKMETQRTKKKKREDSLAKERTKISEKQEAKSLKKNLSSRFKEKGKKLLADTEFLKKLNFKRDTNDTTRQSVAKLQKAMNAKLKGLKYINNPDRFILKIDGKAGVATARLKDLILDPKEANNKYKDLKETHVKDGINYQFEGEDASGIGEKFKRNAESFHDFIEQNEGEDFAETFNIAERELKGEKATDVKYEGMNKAGDPAVWKFQKWVNKNPEIIKRIITESKSANEKNVVKRRIKDGKIKEDGLLGENTNRMLMAYRELMQKEDSNIKENIKKLEKQQEKDQEIRDESDEYQNGTYDSEEVILIDTKTLNNIKKGISFKKGEKISVNEDSQDGLRIEVKKTDNANDITSFYYPGANGLPENITKEELEEVAKELNSSQNG